MRRGVPIHVLGLISMLALVAACGGSSSTADTVDPTSTAAPTSTSSVASTSTTRAPEQLLETADDGSLGLVVAGADGITLVDPRIDGFTRVLDGDIDVALDDRRGGVVFQIDRPGAGPADRTLWHLAAGEEAASPLVEVEPGVSVHLQDVADREGASEVYYLVDSTAVEEQSLWAIELTGAEPRQVALTGSGESRASGVSVGGQLVSWTWSGEGLASFGFADLAGDPVEVSVDPYQGVEAPCFGEVACSFALTSDASGERLAWIADIDPDVPGQVPQLVVVDLAGGTELHRWPLAEVTQYQWGVVDLAGPRAVVNRFDEAGRPDRALVVDLDTGASTALALAGTARFVSSTPLIDGPVALP